MEGHYNIQTHLGASVQFSDNLQIVAALFPSTVRDRLMGQEHENKPGPSATRKNTFRNQAKEPDAETSLPIADLFPNASVM